MKTVNVVIPVMVFSLFCNAQALSQQTYNRGRDVNKRVRYNEINVPDIRWTGEVACVVSMKLFVTPDGKVDSVSLIGSSDCPLDLVETIKIAAGEQLRFSPANDEEIEVFYYTVKILPE